MIRKNEVWNWKGLEVSWKLEGLPKSSSCATATLLIHGFGASKEHWRHNQSILGAKCLCYAIDLVGFGESSQPPARLPGEKTQIGDFSYCFDSWSSQVADFCREIIQKPVILIGNSIGGIVALRAAQLLKNNCYSVVLIDCAQRQLDDKRLLEQPPWLRWTRPLLKKLVQQKWLSQALFQNAATPSTIRRVLQQAYPSGNNVNLELINLLYKPSQRNGASEAFQGFINLFDDYLAPELIAKTRVPIDLIWGEKDPWEPIEEAQHWLSIYNQND